MASSEGNGAEEDRCSNMLNKDERKNLYKNIERRILDGVHKQDIYAEYSDERDSRLVARILANIPTAQRRIQFRFLNWILVVTIGILAAIKLLVVTLFVLTEIPQGALLILLAPAINILLIWMVVRFKGVGYLLTIAFSLSGLSRVMEGFEMGLGPIDLTINSISLVCVATAIIIAAVLMRKLLPQTSFFLTPKRDGIGNPIFEG